MTEYLDTWRKSLQERGARVSRPNTQFMDFTFEPVKILGEELDILISNMFLPGGLSGPGAPSTCPSAQW